MNIPSATERAALQRVIPATSHGVDTGPPPAGKHDRPTFPVQYWPFLDGVRGLSILAVLGVHSSVPFMPAGYFGVDIFFVLSGFLITCLLLEEWTQSGSIRLRDFYIRRALRLVPALVVFLTITTVWSALARPQEIATTLKAVAFAIVYLTNWAWAFNWVPMTPVSHTWSLAIEEQFYLLWPLGLLLILRAITTTRRRVATIVTAIVASIALRTGLAITSGMAMRSYVGIDTRADGLLMGCLAAFLVRWDVLPRTLLLRRTIQVVSIAAVAFLLVMIGTIHSPSAYVLYGLPTVGLAAALVLFSLFYAPISLMRRLLEAAPLTWLGRRAYGVYLWHFPFIVLPLAKGFSMPYR
ncbi:MAG: acyltransferase family protein, partial [Thermoanaerobaculia bacterium]